MSDEDYGFFRIEMINSSNYWKMLRVSNEYPLEETEVLATLSVGEREPDIITAFYDRYLSLDYTPEHHEKVVSWLENYASSRGKTLVMNKPTVLQNFNDVWSEIQKIDVVFKNWDLGEVFTNCVDGDNTHWIYEDEMNALKGIIEKLGSSLAN